MPRPKVHDDELRVRILDRAGEALTENGPHGLGLRTLAARAGTSTSAVYSLFGGKPGLVRALYIEAFRRFREHLLAAPTSDDAAEDLVQLGLAYRRSAREDPHLYSIMFSRPVPDFEPDEDACAAADGAFDVLRQAAARAVAAGELPGPPERVALTAWALVHGLVSLELAGTVPPGVDVGRNYEAVLRAGLLR